MNPGNIFLMLVYEPTLASVAPVPLARICDRTLAVAVAQSAVAQAETQADEVYSLDQLLGEIEQAEARRLREVLGLLVPGFSDQQIHCSRNTPVM
jgi:Asp/Glu/hydantoin racemase